MRMDTSKLRRSSSHPDEQAKAMMKYIRTQKLLRDQKRMKRTFGHRTADVHDRDELVEKMRQRIGTLVQRGKERGKRALKAGDRRIARVAHKVAKWDQEHPGRIGAGMAGMNAGMAAWHVHDFRKHGRSGWDAGMAGVHTALGASNLAIAAAEVRRARQKKQAKKEDIMTRDSLIEAIVQEIIGRSPGQRDSDRQMGRLRQDLQRVRYELDAPKREKYKKDMKKSKGVKAKIKTMWKHRKVTKTPHVFTTPASGGRTY